MPRGIHKHAKHNTICEVHRKIYDKLENFSVVSCLSPEDWIGELKELTMEAFEMAKKMSNKLLQYNRNLGSDWYQSHKDDGGKITDK